jgi:hypothetical protein
MMQTVFLAELETTNFRFRAIGSSYGEASLTLKKVFEKHIKRTQGTWTWEDVADSVYVNEFKSGEGMVF